MNLALSPAFQGSRRSHGCGRQSLGLLKRRGGWAAAAALAESANTSLDRPSLIMSQIPPSRIGVLLRLLLSGQSRTYPARGGYLKSRGGR